MPHFPDQICYSDKYYDKEYEYRHVLLTKDYVLDPLTAADTSFVSSKMARWKMDQRNEPPFSDRGFSSSPCLTPEGSEQTQTLLTVASGVDCTCH